MGSAMMGSVMSANDDGDEDGKVEFKERSKLART
jgi:hypothetical protein